MESFFPAIVYLIDEDGELASNKVPVQNINNPEITLTAMKTGTFHVILESKKTGIKVYLSIYPKPVIMNTGTLAEAIGYNVLNAGKGVL